MHSLLVQVPASIWMKYPSSEIQKGGRNNEDEPTLDLKEIHANKNLERNQLAKNTLNIYIFALNFFFSCHLGGTMAPTNTPPIPSLGKMATLFFLDSCNSAQPLPSLWLFILSRRSFFSMIFWLCQFLQGFLDQLFSKQIYVFAANPSPICVITPSSLAPMSLVDNKRFPPIDTRRL